MVSRDLVARKVARARQWLSDADARVQQPRETFLASTESRDLATFYIFLAIQDAIDLGAHWVADEGWGTPDDAGGTFDILAARGAIPVELADRLRLAVGLRNRIAHGYAAIDHERLHKEATLGIGTLRDFLARIADAAQLTGRRRRPPAPSGHHQRAVTTRSGRAAVRQTRTARVGRLSNRFAACACADGARARGGPARSPFAPLGFLTRVNASAASMCRCCASFHAGGMASRI